MKKILNAFGFIVMLAIALTISSTEARAASDRDVSANDYHIELNTINQWNANTIFEFHITGPVDNEAGDVDLGDDPDVSMTFLRGDEITDPEVELTYTTGGSPRCIYDPGHNMGSIDCTVNIVSTASELEPLSFIIMLEHGSTTWETPVLALNSCEPGGDGGGGECVKGNSVCAGGLIYGSEECVGRWLDVDEVIESSRSEGAYESLLDDITVRMTLFPFRREAEEYKYIIEGPFDATAYEADDFNDIVVIGQRVHPDDDVDPEEFIILKRMEKQSCSIMDDRVTCELWIEDREQVQGYYNVRILAAGEGVAWLSPVFKPIHCEVNQSLVGNIWTGEFAVVCEEGPAEKPSLQIADRVAVSMQPYLFGFLFEAEESTDPSELDEETTDVPEDDGIVEDVQVIEDETEAEESNAPLLPPQYIIGNSSDEVDVSEGGGCSLSGTASSIDPTALLLFACILIPLAVTRRTR